MHPKDGSLAHEPIHQADIRWQQVFRLGAELLAAVPNIPAGESGQPEYQELQNLKALILDASQRLLAGQAALWLSSQDEFAAASTQGTPDQGETRTPLMQQAIDQRRTTCRPDGTAAAAPLFLGAENQEEFTLLGALQIERSNQPFGAEDLLILEGIALQASTALHARQQIALDRWRVKQLGLVRQVSSQVANSHNLDDLAHRVTGLILKTFDYYYVAVFTLEPDDLELCFRASAGPRRPAGDLPDQFPVQVISARIGEGIIGQVALTGYELLAEDVSRSPHYSYEASLPETRSELAIPLKLEGRLLGVLDVQSNLPNDFNATDLLVLRALASNIAVAIEGTRMVSALDRRAEQLRTLYEISGTITSILDQDEMLDQVANLIHKNFAYAHIQLFTVHSGRRKIFYAAGKQEHEPHLQARDVAHDLDEPSGLVPWVARHGETALVNDVRIDPRFSPSPSVPHPTLAELTIPFVFGGEVLGVLDIQSQHAHVFGDEQRFFFEALADSVATALHNTLMYRSEQFQRRVADSLREVAGLLTTDTELDQVLQAILGELTQTLPCDLAAIWLEEIPGDTPEPGACPELQLSAVRGTEAQRLELKIGSRLLEASQAASHLTPESDEQLWTWIATALQSDVPLIRLADASREPLGALLNFPDDYSAIAAPLRIGDRRLGLLVMAHRTARRYGSESSLMIAAFASYAAVAIENARLYEAAHEQAWVSTVLLEVARITQEVHDLGELVETITRTAPTLAGFKACILYLRDEDGTFLPAAASGIETQHQADFARWKFAPGDVPVLDQLVKDRKPIILAAGPEEAPLAGILSSPGDDEGTRAVRLMLVPLISRGETIGAFLAEAHRQPASAYEYDLESFSDVQLAIVEGIVRQTALAIENLRLTHQQQEDAYVSVALLQVAQAIACNTDLPEILGTITQLAPNLIGVKRAAIFLFNTTHHSYQMAAGVGFSQTEVGNSYPFEEFPLLDAVRRVDEILAYSSREAVTEDAHAIATWQSLSAPALHPVGDILALEESLIIVLPISGLNDLMGAIIVEEPDPAPYDLSRFISSNRHLREKRLEIATGISQQAALAIQNDRFQRELVQRERLERELQLAHDIQRSLLPSELPKLPGWNMQVLWETAHEVGGDFFDIFVLPDDNLGIAIADVADKGMAAALYMTHVHASLRAITQTVVHPSETLARLNDTLAADAAHGMFVTLFYGVLNLHSGQLSYANAGHNPPLHLKASSSQITSINQSGMALGVMRSQRAEPGSLTLDPGDALILYTDGVTENFSRQGQMFGEQQLQQVIRLTSRLPYSNLAVAILDAIQEKLTEFRGEQPLSDDLTLLVITRQPGD